MNRTNIFTEQEFFELKGSLVLKKFSKGDFIIKENDYVQDVYLISSGLVKLFYTDYDSKEHILSFAFEDWWETDFSAFYNKERAVFSLQCIEDTEAYSLSYDDFFAACQNFTQLTDYFLAKSIRGHIANQKRILSLLTLNPKERYELFLQIYPSLSQRISKSVLASYLGVSRETLSRLYKQHK